MFNYALTEMAKQYVYHIKKVRKIEKNYLTFDCQFTDRQAELDHEFHYKTAAELELMACRDRESCEAFGQMKTALLNGGN